jgi:hypothetical protein
MQDLTGQHLARLTPTSQEAGGMVYSNQPAMTAPGSDPVTPMKTPYGAPMPFEVPEALPSGQQTVPLSGQASRTAGNPAPAGNRSGGGWENTDDKPAAGMWKKV